MPRVRNILATILLAVTPALAQLPTGNLVPNGDFQTLDAQGWAVGWPHPGNARKTVIVGQRGPHCHREATTCAVIARSGAAATTRSRAPAEDCFGPCGASQ